MVFKSLLALVILGMSVCYGRYLYVDTKDKQDYKSSPPFCHGLECPKFTVVKTTKDFDIRSYEKSVWVSTEILGMDYDEATSTGFGRLFKYISGDNEPKEKIDMTAPVITRVIPGQGPACESNFTVSFFVPFKYQKDPPKPTASNVHITTIEKHEACVRSFTGYANQTVYLKEADQLAKALEKVTIPYSKGFFYTAGYDPPFRPFDRHNEVWFFIDQKFTDIWYTDRNLALTL